MKYTNKEIEVRAKQLHYDFDEFMKMLQESDDDGAELMESSWVWGNNKELKKEIHNLKNNTWFSIQEAAQYLGVSVRTLYRLINDNKIPFKLIPGTTKIRFKKRHLDIWIETGKNAVTDKIPTKLIKEINDLE